MSRTFGRSYEVYNVSKELKETKIPKYKKDYRECSWKDIEETPEHIELYLPDRAIDYLTSKKIKIMKTPFLRYTTMQIPENEDEDRYVKFPSILPKIEFKRELMFYMGMLLSDYNKDKDNENYGIPDEYDDTLPLFLEYLYLKKEKEQDRFSIKHLNELKGYQKNYQTFYDDYQDFENLRRDAVFSNLDNIKYEKFQKLCKEKEEEIASLTKDSIIQLSSFEGALGLIENVKTKGDIKKVIEELMLNEQGNRGIILRDREIESYGYKRLRKELEKNRK